MKCFCTFVHDGDTIAVDPNCGGFKWVRLASIDAPEIDQQLGKESRDSLASLCAKRQVELNVITIDRYGRAIAQVLVDGTDASVFQVRQGMAFPYFLNNKNQTEIMIANTQAKESRLGVWALKTIVLPSQFRLQNKETVDSKLSVQLPQVTVEQTQIKEIKPDEKEVDITFSRNTGLFVPAIGLLPFVNPAKQVRL